MRFGRRRLGKMKPVSETMRARKPMIDESGEVRELTAADIETFKRSSAALLPSLRAKTGVRGPQKAPTKSALSLRLSPQVVEAFRPSGDGFKTHSPERLAV